MGLKVIYMLFHSISYHRFKILAKSVQWFQNDARPNGQAKIPKEKFFFFTSTIIIKTYLIFYT